jgi:hypothetical protein
MRRLTPLALLALLLLAMIIAACAAPAADAAATPVPSPWNETFAPSVPTAFAPSNGPPYSH